MRRVLSLLLLIPLLSCGSAGAQLPTGPRADDITDLGYLGSGISAIEDRRRRVTCYAHINGGVACIAWGAAR